MAIRVALVGAGGYGAHHRRFMVPLQEAGRIELVGLCDVRPICDEPGAPVPDGAVLTGDLAELLAIRPEIVVVATPPHTHLEIATASVRAGADVLLEKPPFVSLAEHRAFSLVLDETGRRCQIGFQALGSAALAALTTAIGDGRLGRVTGVGAYGGWQRPDSYYDRAPWAGRRTVDGRPVLDGALVNPFAHAVMQSLAVAAACGPVSIADVEMERYRVRDIEVDDTSMIRVHLASGPDIVVAVTLCSDEVVEPRVVVHGDAGRAVLDIKSDELALPGDLGSRTIPGRAGLLENLLDHRAAPDEVPLLAPLARTLPFTTVVEANRADDPPVAITPEYISGFGHGAERVVTIPGVVAVLRAAAESLKLPSELGAPWARRS